MFEDPTLSLQWHRFSFWPGKSCMLRVWQKKKKKKKSWNRSRTPDSFVKLKQETDGSQAEQL